MKPARQKSINFGNSVKILDEPEQPSRISNGPNIYQIGAEIGRGGFAVVFQAFNVETGDFVAVKRFPLKAIDDDSLSSIESEIELMQKLNHPNIVKYIDTIRTKDFLHIVLEYMENGSLSNVIKKFGSFSESLTAIYITQVLRGLKYLHEQGVLHRDIKGANILTTKDGMVKLADFGVAMKLSEAHADDQDVVGSPYWIAPEIIEMSAPTAACDIWSVGCIIIELLTRKPPYYDLAPMAALFRIVQDDYPPLPEGISQALRDFLLLCFQKEPIMRSSAAKLLEHPWLHNSSTNSNLAQTSKLLTSKSTSSSGDIEQANNADSIVNTIRNYQMEVTSVPPPTESKKSSGPSSKNAASATPNKRKIPSVTASMSMSMSPDTEQLKRSHSMSYHSNFAESSSPQTRVSSTSTGVSSGERVHKTASSEAQRAVPFSTHSDSSRSGKAASSRTSTPISESSTATKDTVPTNSRVLGLASVSVDTNDDDLSFVSEGGSPRKKTTSTLFAGMQKISSSSGSDSSGEEDDGEDWEAELLDADNISQSLDSYERRAAETGGSGGKLAIDVAGGSGSNEKANLRKNLLPTRSETNLSAVPKLSGNLLRRKNLKSNSCDTYSPTSLAAAGFFAAGSNRSLSSTSNKGGNSHNSSSASLGRPTSFIVSATGSGNHAAFLLMKFQEHPEEEDNFDDLIQASSSSDDHPAVPFLAPRKKDEVSSDDDFDCEKLSNAKLNNKIRSYSSLHASQLSQDSNPLEGVSPSVWTRKTVPALRNLSGLSNGPGSLDSGRLQRYASNHDVEDFDDLEAAGEHSEGPAESGGDMAGKLRMRMQQSTSAAVEEETDEFINYQFDEKDFRQNEHKDVHFRRSREVVGIMAKIRTETKEKEVVDLCSQLMNIFTEFPEQREHLVTYHGVMPIIDMIEARSSHELQSSTDSSAGSAGAASSGARRKVLRPFVLRVVNKIIEGSTRAQEQLSLVGIIPTIMNIFDRSHRSIDPAATPGPMHPYHHQTSSISSNGSGSIFATLSHSNSLRLNKEVDPVTLEAARFIHQISSTSSLTLQMLIGAGGLSVLTNMVSFGAKIVSRNASPVTETHRPGNAVANNSITLESLSLHNTSGVKKRTSFSDNLLIGSQKSELLSQPEDTVKTDNLPVSPLINSSSSDLIACIPPLNLHTDDEDVSASMSIFQMGIDCITNVFSVQSSRTRDFCRLFVKLGLLPHLSVAFQNILSLYLLKLASVSTGSSTPLLTPRSRQTSKDLGRATSFNVQALSTTSGNASPEHSGVALHAHSLATKSMSVNNLNTQQTHGGPHQRHKSSGSSDSTLSLHGNLLFETVENSPEKRYTQQIATLFFKFSRSDAIVAETMAHNDLGVITVILAALKAPELRAAFDNTTNSTNTLLSAASNYSLLQSPVASVGSSDLKRKTSMAASLPQLHPSYVEIVELLLKCLKNLSMEPSALADLEKAGIIEVLLPLLSGPISDKCKNHILPCMFNMCRINKRRQEQAAVLGIIPHLKKVITDGSHLRQFALPILFDLAHASSQTRVELWKNDCVSFYLDLLKENYWQTFALNSLAIWMTYDSANVSRLLVDLSKLAKLIDFFRAASIQTIHTLHKPLYDMMFKSRELSRALACSALFVSALVKRLTATSEAIVLRSLLKMLQLMHQNHPCPRQLVLDNNLYSLVKDFAQSEGQVLVCQIANRLLRDFQYSTLT